jgi:hypothetical protein
VFFTDTWTLAGPTSSSSARSTAIRFSLPGPLGFTFQFLVILLFPGTTNVHPELPQLHPQIALHQRIPAPRGINTSSLLLTFATSFWVMFPALLSTIVVAVAATHVWVLFPALEPMLLPL